MNTHNQTLSVGPERLVSVRYVMKNARQEVVIDTMDVEPVRFIYGSGDILPALEGPLTGLTTGERKSFVVLPGPESGFDQTYHFDVIIDNVVALPEDDTNPSGLPPATDACGPGCKC